MEAFKQFPKVYIRYQENKTELRDRKGGTEPAEAVTWTADSIEILMNILPLIRKENGKLNISYNFTHLSYILKINKQEIYMKLIELYHLQGDNKNKSLIIELKMASEDRGKAHNKQEREEKEQKVEQQEVQEQQQKETEMEEQQEEEMEIDPDQPLAQCIPSYDTSISVDNPFKDKLELLKLGNYKSTSSLNIDIGNLHGKSKLSSSMSSYSNSSSTSSASAINIANASMYLQRTRILNPQSGSIPTSNAIQGDEALVSGERDDSEGYLLDEDSLGSSLLEEEVLKRI